MTSGSSANGVTGGLSYGSGTVSGNKVEIKGGTVGGNILGGYNTGTGAASSNTVELTGGTITANVYGGSAGSGAADTNTVTVKNNVTGNVFGGNASGSASGNTVDLGAVTVTGVVVGGQGGTANNNKVNMEGSTVGSHHGRLCERYGQYADGKGHEQRRQYHGLPKGQLRPFHSVYDESDAEHHERLGNLV